MTDKPAAPGYAFWGNMGRIINSGQSRSIVLSGDITDLFYLPDEDRYVPILDFLVCGWGGEEVRKHFIRVVYELNGPIRFLDDADKAHVSDAWMRLTTGSTAGERAIHKLVRPPTAEEPEGPDFDRMLAQAAGSPTAALELLRQLCLASRSPAAIRPAQAVKNLLIIIEGADMLIPQGEIAHLSEADRKRVAICRDWFSDPGFTGGADSAILLAESRSGINGEVARLPQLLEVQVPSPDRAQRAHFISWFIDNQPDQRKPKLWSTPDELADLTAGLSTQAMIQMLKAASHTGKPLQPKDVVAKVEEFIRSQLGEDVVEFYKPSHGLDEVVGNRRLRDFLVKRFVPRLRRIGKGSISGCVLAGALGSGKSFIGEAVAAELGIVVLVLKNIRSKWFGETDVMWERLRRSLDVFSKILIFVDEADTQFGSVGPDAHPTERRLTGRIQATMADSKLRGRVIWMLMTARVGMLSADIRRPGRAGDFIIPVLDPEGDDLTDFIRWAIKPVRPDASPELLARLADITAGYSAAAMASLKDELIAEADGGALDDDAIFAVVHDRITPDIGRTRRIQILDALLNCTHRSLLPEGIVDLGAAREAWHAEMALLGPQ
jgi:hypothetical protein